MTWLIRFDFGEDVMAEPNTILYAGWHKGGLGWAPTPKTAIEYDNPEVAARVLANGYGSLAKYGEVIQLDN
jgi:hypothetical protein